MDPQKTSRGSNKYLKAGGLCIRKFSSMYTKGFVYGDFTDVL